MIGLAIWGATNIFSTFCSLFSFGFSRRITPSNRINNELFRPCWCSSPTSRSKKPTNLHNEFPSPRRCVTNEKGLINSFQCCIRDGSRPAAYVMQLGYANHLEVLYSKDMVLNVQAKGSVRHYQVSVKKLNANEPLKTCRKRNLVGKTVGFFALTG
jgi:hypothetical protein